MRQDGSRLPRIPENNEIDEAKENDKRDVNGQRNFAVKIHVAKLSDLDRPLRRKRC